MNSDSLYIREKIEAMVVLTGNFNKAISPGTEFLNDFLGYVMHNYRIFRNPMIDIISALHYRVIAPDKLIGRR